MDAVASEVVMRPFEPAIVPAPAELEVVVEVPLVADFDSYYAAQFERAVGLAYALCGNRGAAEELAQEAFSIPRRPKRFGWRPRRETFG